jgi:hypothetical protein
MGLLFNRPKSVTLAAGLLAEKLKNKVQSTFTI